MSAPPTEPSPAARAAVSAGGLALAVFFGALGVAILRMPFEPGTPWWAEWAIRAFVALIFGSIAGLGLYGFVVSVRGPREPPLPGPLLVRCPACGEPILPTTDCCPGCARAPGQVGRGWREVPREGASGVLVVAGIGGGVLSLGVLLAGSALSGKEGLLLSLAYAGLALLLVLVGGAMLYGGVLALRDAYRARGRRSFTLAIELDGASITASATFAPGSVALRGATVTRRALDAAPDPGPHDAPLHPAHRAMVRTLAVLHARGEASLSLLETLEWAADADDEPTRHVGVDLEVSARPPRVEVPTDARDIVLSALAEGETVRLLAGSLPDDAGLRNAFEAYATRLSADEVEPRTSRILAAVLAGGAAAAPYRQPG